MKVVILCGGFGTRLSEQTDLRPKPMVEIGNRPILWHIMKHYAHFGHKEFIIALGYKSEVIKRYFLDYNVVQSTLTVHLASGDVLRRNTGSEDWTVHLIDTGLNTSTGGRLKRVANLLGRETFLFTYGDGFTNVNVDELIAFHRRHGKLATVTAVHPAARFGAIIMQEEDGQVLKFAEKPQASEGWINGGYFVLEPGVLDYIAGDDMPWEAEPLDRLVQENQLVAYRHDDFWQCMDTLRDVKLLESLWQDGTAPWKMWD